MNNAHVTYLTNKLRAIQKFIYGNYISEDLTEMFTHLIEKTVPSSYLEYTIQDNGKTKLTYLTERYILLQQYFLRDCIKTASNYWKEKANENTLNKIKERYTISVSNPHENVYIVTVGNCKITISGGLKGTVTVTGNIENIESLVEDLAQLYVDEDVERVGKQLKSDSTLTNLFAPVIASIIVNTAYADFKPPFGNLRDLAKVLSVMHGSDVVNVVKNGDDNNLPLYQMLCLAYRHTDIHKRLSDEIKYTQVRSPFVHNIAYNNVNNIYSPQIRTGVKTANGIYKTSASLSADEVLHLAIRHDFYDNLFEGQTIVENTTQRSGLVGFQVHVYSDKNKHFIQMFDLDAE